MYRLLEKCTDNYTTTIKVRSFATEDAAIEALLKEFRMTSDFMEMRDRDMTEDIAEIEEIIKKRRDYCSYMSSYGTYWIEEETASEDCVEIRLNSQFIDKIETFWSEEHSKHIDKN